MATANGMDASIDISLLLPTRGRLAQVRRALDSVACTASRPERLEVVLYVDRDDTASHSIDHDRLRLVRLVRERTRMGAITQACYQASTGRYLMLANDDIVFRTSGWDTVVLAAFARFADDVALVWGNDLCGGAPAHPFIPRTACQVMRGICPADYHREYIDTHLYDVFRLLRSLGHERLVHLPDVIIEHLHCAAGKAASDATYIKHHHFQDERIYIDWDEERRRAADYLARHITGCQAASGP